MLELILSKKSSESEIKSYFNAVLELSKSDNEFPINLDEVWMLVYGRKEEAVRALTSSEQFIENIDYQVLRKNAENQKGGRPTNEYKLTVSCMEFFIARKVRPVFEVYRQVFHKVAKHELSRKELALMVVQAEEEKERLALENKKAAETNRKTTAESRLCRRSFQKILFSFGSLRNCCTFAVLQLTIKYANGIFYARKETYILKYRQTISVYHRPMAMVGCSKLGYLSAFLFNNK